MIGRRTLFAYSRCRTVISPLPWRLRRYSLWAPSESVTVPCHSNGSITLDIFHPPNAGSGRNDAPSVVLHLPHGLPAQDAEQDEADIDSLRSNLDLPIVQINYRLDQGHRFPTPVHDVLAGYDWVLDNLLPKRSIVRAGRSESVGRIAVCGRYVGGGLATALALTECRIGEPGVVAASVSDPIVDWISLQDEAPPKKQRTSTSPSSASDSATLSATELLNFRSQLFTRPAHYFDPFASPILFFRSAGAEVPSAPAVLLTDDLEHLSVLNREEAYREEVGELANGHTEVVPVLKRKSSRRFPSKTLGIRLPSFYISANAGSALSGQALELASLLRQSFVRQRKNTTAGGSSFGRKVLIEGEEDQLNDDEKAVLEMGIADARDKVRLNLHKQDRVESTATDELERIELLKAVLKGPV